MSREIELLTEIRDLLQVMAEPLLAKREEKLRAALREVVGSGKYKQGAVVLMDGTRTQAAIAREAGINQGYLSRLIKALSAKGLIGSDKREPRLLVKVPPMFFNGDDDDD
ncbi:MAG: helix-turn-helix domain-containing protein [Planctomycetota bacterium]|nr:helix-turn-helix domain-containing protein [Planctomycetota bacterium]